MDDVRTVIWPCEWSELEMHAWGFARKAVVPRDRLEEFLKAAVPHDQMIQTCLGEEQ